MTFLFKKLALGLVCFGFSISASQSFAKTYYKWVDSRGSTHYTTTPPPKSAKRKGKVDTYGWKNSSPMPSSDIPAATAAPSNTTPAPSPSAPAAAPATVPNAPTPGANLPLNNQQREANEALQQSQQARPAV